MKTYFSLAAVFVFSVLAVPSVADAAASVVFQGSPVNVTVGETYTVIVAVNPSGAPVYTSHLTIAYPTDMLTFTSFTLAPSWVALTQPGYDGVDTDLGIITKTAGLPSGLTKTTTFGTLVFTAKKSGNAEVRLVSKDSELLDKDSENVLGSGSAMSAVVIGHTNTTAATSATTPVTAETPVVSSSNARAPGSAANNNTMVTNDAIASQGDANDSASTTQVAAVAQAAANDRSTYLLYGLLAAIAALIVGFVIVPRLRTQKAQA